MQKILIADDDGPTRELIRASLEEEGEYETLEARNGEEALALIILERPDFAFIDVRMPLRNGVEVCSAIKADPIAGSTKVILFTGSDDARTSADAYAAGADGFFRKPFSPHQVRDQLRKVRGLA